MLRFPEVYFQMDKLVPPNNSWYKPTVCFQHQSKQTTADINQQFVPNINLNKQQATADIINQQSVSSYIQLYLFYLELCSAYNIYVHVRNLYS